MKTYAEIELDKLQFLLDNNRTLETRTAFETLVNMITQLASDVAELKAEHKRDPHVFGGEE